MGNKTGHLESVDAALRLLQMLGRDGQLRVTDAADELGVAASTAHRLLSTLRYRGFAVQAGDRTYRPGPAFTELAASHASSIDLCGVARPHLEWLRTTLDETSHLVVLIGHDVHFLASAEARRPLRVGARVGAVLPAHRTSGGKALLAALSREEIEQLYPLGQAGRGLLTMTETAILRRELETTRRRGYGINMGESERGIAALGVLVRGYDGHPIAAVTVSVPAVRFSGDRVKELVAAIQTAAKRIDADLALQTTG